MKWQEGLGVLDWEVDFPQDEAGEHEAAGYDRADDISTLPRVQSCSPNQAQEEHEKAATVQEKANPVESLQQLHC